VKKVFSILFIAFAALVVVSSSAFSGECPMEKSEMAGMYEKGDSKMDLEDTFSQKIHFIMANSDEIGLSAEQLEKIHTLKYSVKKSIIKNDAEIEILALDIKEALGKDDIDIGAANSLIDKKYMIKAQKTKDIVAACANLKTIMTKEQQKKMQDMCSKHKKEKIEGEEKREEGKKPMMRGMDMHKN
jgi:Spy/CpxP family protein refolding chaperone